jgi:hypothetical protein
MQAEYANQRSFGLVKVVMILALLILIFQALPLIGEIAGEVNLAFSHGEVKHGTAAIRIRNCLNDKGPYQEWKNPTTGRIARICQLDEKTWGVQIVERADDGWREVTAFLKEKCSRFDQLAKNLINRGYVPPQ